MREWCKHYRPPTEPQQVSTAATPQTRATLWPVLAVLVAVLLLGRYVGRLS